MVRQSGDDEMVERSVVKRGFCKLFGMYRCGQHFPGMENDGAVHPG